ncbi:MAG: hypothetical protein JWN38_306 [Candidatus Saccharibacteria bacterium]|nr:hypothetical protein [Candidatus Saccharibacteria bacterium]
MSKSSSHERLDTSLEPRRGGTPQHDPRYDTPEIHIDTRNTDSDLRPSLSWRARGVAALALVGVLGIGVGYFKARSNDQAAEADQINRGLAATAQDIGATRTQPVKVQNQVCVLEPGVKLHKSQLPVVHHGLFSGVMGLKGDVVQTLDHELPVYRPMIYTDPDPTIGTRFGFVINGQTDKPTAGPDATPAEITSSLVWEDFYKDSQKTIKKTEKVVGSDGKIVEQKVTVPMVQCVDIDGQPSTAKTVDTHWTDSGHLMDAGGATAAYAVENASYITFSQLQHPKN